MPLAAAAEAARDAILLTDRQQTIVAANPAALVLFGYGQAELVGQPLARLLADAPQPAAGRAPVVGRRRDGSEFPAEAAVSRVESAGPGPGPAGFVATVSELSPWRDLPQPLDVLAQRLRDLLDLAPVALWITEHERVSFANRAAHHLFGLEPGRHLVGQSVHALVRTARPDALRAHIDHVLQGASPAPVVHGSIVRPDGEQREVEIASTALPDHGRTVLQMVITDITRRQQDEREHARHRSVLRQLSASMVEAREEERRRIARELHDELGQRLTALKMALSSLRLEGLGGADRQRVEGMFEMIDDTVSALRRIAADLRPLMLDDLGLNASIEALARDAARRLDMEVTVRLADDDPPLPAGAAIAVYRMVQEALTNVARHARATDVRIELLHQSDEAVLTVQDNGVGFPADAIAAEGRFGLLGIRERALMLGGRLEIDNPPGGGARIRVYLPLDPAAATTASPP